MSAPERGIRLDGRVIPIPQSISKPAQAALARLIGVDSIPLHAKCEMPALDDTAGWKQLKAASDAQYEAAVKRLAGSLQSTVTAKQTQAAIRIVLYSSSPVRCDACCTFQTMKMVRLRSDRADYHLPVEYFAEDR